MAEPVLPVVLIGAGAYLSWFGVHYWRTDVAWPTEPVKAVLTGKPIPVGTSDTSSAVGLFAPLAQPGQTIGSEIAPTGPAAGGGFGHEIARAALRYQGAGYVWGGDASTPGNWDCSSFVSKVLGQDLGLELPGGGRWGDPGYPPHAHGPGSTAYMLYGVGIAQAQVQPGDLIVSTEHIGICVDAGQMISAEDPQRGTRLGTFPAGFPAGPPVYRRVAGPGTGAGGAPFPGAG